MRKRFNFLKVGGKINVMTQMDGSVHNLAGSLIYYYGEKYTSNQQNIIRRCNQKCRDRARDRDKQRRSNARMQQAQLEQSTQESIVNPILEAIASSTRQILEAISSTQQVLQLHGNVR